MVTQLSLFDAIEIPLTRGYVALVDPIDADLAQYKWYASTSKHNRTNYAERATQSKKIVTRFKMHRVILERILGRALEQNEVVDHIDSNGLNNRRSNLRIASQNENSFNRVKHKDNTSGYKGVSLCKRTGRWGAYININRRRAFLGYFDTPELAYRAYCESAKEHYGEFANLGGCNDDK